jgi:acetate kinase
MRVLVLNPGSATLKATVLAPPDRAALFDRTDAWATDAEHADRERVVRSTLQAIGAAGIDPTTIDAVGFRVVHGGERFTEPTDLDDAAVAAIDALSELAPLHNPIALATIRAGRAALPGLRHVAVFDTAFHATLPASARRYPVPTRWTTDYGIRRYGFHGLSVAWSTLRAAELLERPASMLRLVVAHLGGGASVTAVEGGRSVETSMGLTPLEGLMMGTRSGSIDPGILFRLLRKGLSPDDVEASLEHRSGLLGVGGTNDMRRLLAAEAEGDTAAALAIDLFVRRAAAGIAAAATSLSELDAIVFTGGIGAGAAVIRNRVCARLGSLRVPMPAEAGGRVPAHDDDAVVAVGDEGPAVLRILAREELVIAEAVASHADGRSR